MKEEKCKISKDLQKSESECEIDEVVRERDEAKLDIQSVRY
jgi:hypothetical protein